MVMICCKTGRSEIGVFKKCQKALKNLHYNRLALREQQLHVLPKSPEEAEKQGFVKAPDSKNIYHRHKRQMGNVMQKNETSIAGLIKIDEKEIGDHLNQLIRQSVEDTINSLLDAEADAVCNATCYQHS